MMRRPRSTLVVTDHEHCRLVSAKPERTYKPLPRHADRGLIAMSHVCHGWRESLKARPSLQVVGLASTVKNCAFNSNVRSRHRPRHRAFQQRAIVVMLSELGRNHVTLTLEESVETHHIRTFPCPGRQNLHHATSRFLRGRQSPQTPFFVIRSRPHPTHPLDKWYPYIYADPIHSVVLMLLVV